MELLGERVGSETVAEYLPRLVRLARRRARQLPRFAKYTAQYQQDGQDLQRVNFRPEGQIWAEFKLIARGCRASMCYLFVYLLLREEAWSRADRSANEPSFPFVMDLREIARPGGFRFVRRLFVQRE